MKKQDAATEVVQQLERLQTAMTKDWLSDGLPTDWNGLDYWSPVEKPKTRVTLRLDTDMLRWFRAMGPGYQSRINLVLRIYYLGLLGGEIKAYPADDTLPRIRRAAIHQLDAVTEEAAGLIQGLKDCLSD